MKKITTTLCLVLANSQVLLGMKKRGFGMGKWNGFGGKVHTDETLEEAAKRELLEECGLVALGLEQRAVFSFHFENGIDDIELYAFAVTKFEGEPTETEEMRPQWFYENEIPYDKMWADDRLWLPEFLLGKKMIGEFHFKDEIHLLDHKLSVIE